MATTTINQTPASASNKTPVSTSNKTPTPAPASNKTPTPTSTKTSTLAVHLKKVGYQTPINGTTSTAQLQINGGSIVYGLGDKCRLTIRCATQHMFIHASGVHPNVTFRFDTLLRLKHVPTADAAVATSTEGETEQLVVASRRFVFSNKDMDPEVDLNVPTGLALQLLLPLPMEQRLIAKNVVHFRLELDHIYRNEDSFPIYTDSKWSPACSAPMMVQKDGSTELVALYINHKLMAAFSTRYRREHPKQQSGASLTFTDVKLTPCIAFLHQLHTSRQMNWSDAFMVLQTAERLEAPNIWNRSARFILVDNRRSLDYKLTNAYATIQKEDAKWQLISELIAAASALQINKTFADGFDIKKTFHTDADRQKAVDLFDKHRALQLPPTLRIFTLRKRNFGKHKPHTVVVLIEGDRDPLSKKRQMWVNEGVFEMFHSKPITTLPAKDMETFEIYLRFLFDRRPLPMEKLSQLLTFAITHNLPWFTSEVETEAIRHYSVVATVKGQLTTPMMLQLMQLAYEYNLPNLRTMTAFWLQCATDCFWLQLISSNEYAVAVKRCPDSFDHRNARVLAWPNESNKLGDGVNISSKRF